MKCILLNKYHSCTISKDDWFFCTLILISVAELIRTWILHENSICKWKRISIRRKLYCYMEFGNQLMLYSYCIELIYYVFIESIVCDLCISSIVYRQWTPIAKTCVPNIGHMAIDYASALIRILIQKSCTGLIGLVYEPTATSAQAPSQ